MRDLRYVDVSELRSVVLGALRDDVFGDDVVRRSRVLDALDSWVARQPRSPRLVGVTAAAGILGIAKPHVVKLRQQGRLPEPLHVEGPSGPVYVRSEIEALAAELEAERRDRARRREEAAT